MKSSLIPLLAFSLASSAHASLWIDFNSTTQDGGPHNNVGWQPFNKGHEVLADLGPAGARSELYATTFAFTGATNVGLTVDWTNTTDIRVRQSIDRGAGNDANWTDTDLNLVTDWIGIDARTGGLGNGNWDGTTGIPTYMTLTLSGLAAGSYNWTSFHHDTEHVHAEFAVWIDTGTGFTQLADGYMSDSTPLGTPNSALDGAFGPVTTFAGMLAAGSIYNTSFSADGLSDVTLRFAPYAGRYGNAVHNQLWGINGFQLEQIPEPSTGLLGLLGLGLFLRRRR